MAEKKEPFKEFYEGYMSHNKALVDQLVTLIKDLDYTKDVTKQIPKDFKITIKDDKYIPAFNDVNEDTFVFDNKAIVSAVQGVPDKMKKYVESTLKDYIITTPSGETKYDKTFVEKIYNNANEIFKDYVGKKYQSSPELFKKKSYLENLIVLKREIIAKIIDTQINLPDTDDTLELQFLSQIGEGLQFGRCYDCDISIFNYYSYLIENGVNLANNYAEELKSLPKEEYERYNVLYNRDFDLYKMFNRCAHTTPVFTNLVDKVMSVQSEKEQVQEVVKICNDIETMMQMDNE